MTENDLLETANGLKPSNACLLQLLLLTPQTPFTPQTHHMAQTYYPMSLSDMNLFSHIESII
jgi:hypothetical protein